MKGEIPCIIKNKNKAAEIMNTKISATKALTSGNIFHA
jgi:hypothetical protein